METTDEYAGLENGTNPQTQQLKGKLHRPIVSSTPPEIYFFPPLSFFSRLFDILREERQVICQEFEVYQ
jgi:hypothetical protein